MNIQSTVSKDSIQVIHLVRSLAIVSVLALHLKFVLPAPGPSEKWLWDWITSEGGGVSMFLVVSGFLITRILDSGPGGLFRPSWKNFYAGRVGRIIPLFLVHVSGGLLFLFGLIYFFNEWSPLFSFLFKLPRGEFAGSYWISIFTFSLNWVNVFQVEKWQFIGLYWGILWSLSVEEQFYFLYPFFLRWVCSTRRLGWVLAALAAFCFLMKFDFLSEGWSASTRNSVQNNFTCYGEIATGALLYLACRSFRTQLLVKRGWCLFFSAAGMGLILASFYPHYFGHDRLKGIVIGAGTFLFLLGALHLSEFESPWFKVFTLPGKYSYAAYLFHIGILFCVQPFLVDKDPFFALIFFVVLTTAFSFVVYQVFEFPMNNLVRGWFKVALKRKET